MNDLILYTTDDGRSQIKLRAKDQTVWLSQREMAFVSVGHRPSLKAFHDVVLELDGQGGWKLIPAASYDFNSGV